MIEIKELKDEDKGRTVKYRSTISLTKYEYGTITSWNDTYIFVDYHGQGRGQATKPINLDFDDDVILTVNRDGKIIVTPKTSSVDTSNI